MSARAPLTLESSFVSGNLLWERGDGPVVSTRAELVSARDHAGSAGQARLGQTYVTADECATLLWELDRQDAILASGQPFHAREHDRVTQTILHSDPKRVGNCFAACVATAIGVPLERVPHFVEWGIRHYTDAEPGQTFTGSSHWHAMFLGYLAGRGLWPLPIESLDSAPGELVFVSGPSPRGVSHQVLYLDGVLWHDPHPSRAGVTSIDETDLWVIRDCPDHDHAPTPEVNAA